MAYIRPGGSAVVGDETVQAVAFDPDNGIQQVKRTMGTEFPVRIRGQEHTPESISALILRQLVSAAVGPGAKVSAVITVPPYFGLAEREATYQAAVTAGLDVLELLDEPVAAATHYGLTSGRDKKVLVYNLGGSTFDATVLQIPSGAATVLATDGHHELGGTDIDQRLLDLILERLEEQLPADEVDKFAHEKHSQLMRDIATAKENLSTQMTQQVFVNTPNGRVSVSITREDLNTACSDLIEATTEIIERILHAARLNGDRALDEVIMAGSSSRIPALAERLTAMLGITTQLVEPGLAVAKGAALRAHHLARQL